MTDSEIAVRIELPWIPREELRGNSRAHFQVKARYASELRERGFEYGLAAKTLHPHLDFPITRAAVSGDHGVEQAPDRL